MITLTILIVVIGVGIYLERIGVVWGIILCVVFGACLLMHIPGMLLKTYAYNQFVVKRNAFQETIVNARKNKNQYEVAAISQEIAKFNIELAEAKYDNSTFFLDQYVDDRIESLEPIK